MQSVIYWFLRTNALGFTFLVLSIGSIYAFGNRKSKRGLTKLLKMGSILMAVHSILAGVMLYLYISNTIGTDKDFQFFFDLGGFTSTTLIFYLIGNVILPAMYWIRSFRKNLIYSLAIVIFLNYELFIVMYLTATGNISLKESMKAFQPSILFGVIAYLLVVYIMYATRKRGRSHRRSISESAA